MKRYALYVPGHDFGPSSVEHECGGWVKYDDAHDIEVERDSLRAELDAMKARRCDNCRHGRKTGEGGKCYDCMYYYYTDMMVIFNPADFYCKAWEKKGV